MAKRNRNITANTIKRKKSQQLGLGRLSDYSPWNTIQDSASNSLVTRIKGWKTGRIHQILSQLQLQFFYLLEWSPQVIDIREQFPLDQAETAALAGEVGNAKLVEQINAGNFLCLDFLVTVKNGIGTREIARTVINSKSLTNKNLIEKLEIQRQYWAFRNTDWGIVTEKEIEPTIVKNIEWVHSSLDANCLEPLTDEHIKKAESLLTPKIQEQILTLREITSACDEQLDLPVGSALSIVRHLIANKRIKADLTVPFQPAEILKIV
ncbi:MAG: TnsA endonuclease N-terminal domain-containing protein [Pyrinomonadaceae bacterium]|nr:TnsA endonuclease N-terminal domain-containing protein [Pyrinomonadaceae bacterium]